MSETKIDLTIELFQKLKVTYNFGYSLFYQERKTTITYGYLVTLNSPCMSVINNYF